MYLLNSGCTLCYNKQRKSSLYSLTSIAQSQYRNTRLDFNFLSFFSLLLISAFDLAKVNINSDTHKCGYNTKNQD